MKRLLLFVTACVLSCAASAQLVPTKRHVCHARCVGADPDNPKKDRHRQTLKQILDRKAGETDPAKRKTWERAEQEERERHQDELETMCRTVCQDTRRTDRARVMGVSAIVLPPSPQAVHP